MSEPKIAIVRVYIIHVLEVPEESGKVGKRDEKRLLEYHSVVSCRLKVAVCSIAMREIR